MRKDLRYTGVTKRLAMKGSVALAVRGDSKKLNDLAQMFCSKVCKK